MLRMGAPLRQATVGVGTYGKPEGEWHMEAWLAHDEDIAAFFDNYLV